MALEIYKRGQGSAARVTTAIGLGLFGLFGLYDLYTKGLDTWDTPAFAGIEWRMIVTSVVAAGCAALVAWVVNGRKTTDFLIVTESELRKVSWPTRRELQRQTTVVVVFTLLLGVIIFSADYVFVSLSRILFVR